MDATKRSESLRMTFTAWVEPVAEKLRRDRNEVIEFARSVDPNAWERPSNVEGWTCKKILAHLAGGNDQILQQLLRSVVAGEKVDPDILVDTGAENARAIAEQRDKPISDLIEELVRDGDEVQELLSSLDDSHEHLKQDLPFTLGQFMQIVENEGHDLLHLAQLREALEA
jgi:uncharacterized protein (TIGR03083 family)